MELVSRHYGAECTRTNVFHSGPHQTIADVVYVTSGWVNRVKVRMLHCSVRNIPPIEFEVAQDAALVAEPEPL